MSFSTASTSEAGTRGQTSTGLAEAFPFSGTSRTPRCIGSMLLTCWWMSWCLHCCSLQICSLSLALHFGQGYCSGRQVAVGRRLLRRMTRETSSGNFPHSVTFALNNCCVKDDTTAMVIAMELGRSTTVRSSTMRVHGRKISDATGIAIAEALRWKQVLPSFILYERLTRITDTSGLAIAQALQQNTSLRSFAMCGLISGGMRLGVATGEDPRPLPTALRRQSLAPATRLEAGLQAGKAGNTGRRGMPGRPRRQGRQREGRRGGREAR